MEIYTKSLPGGSYGNAIKNLWNYAASVLGAGWHYTDIKLTFTDPTGSGDQGWIYQSAADSGLISNGMTHSAGIDESTVCTNSDPFKGLVWRTSGGSVGIGYVTSGGLYVTTCLLIKFNEKYNDHDLYAVAFNRSDGHGPVWIHGTSDIGSANQCFNGAIGSGVYLHPYYDPVSGLVSSDVFGVRTMSSSGYALNGMIVKQGGTSYLSILGGKETETNVVNALFVKM